MFFNVDNQNLKHFHLRLTSLLIIPAFSFLQACSQNAKTENSPQLIRHIEDSIPYSEFLNELRDTKDTLKSIEEGKQLLFEAFNFSIPNYWIGTKWDFNGMSRVPQEGAVACGYFITNTLSDVGFDIPRIKLAQEPSSVMINQLCVNVKHIAGFENFKKYMASQADNQLYIVGLDFHTGFILKAGGRCYFLHSNYIKHEGVVKEEIELSAALQNSESYMIGSLTANTKLIEAWVGK